MPTTGGRGLVVLLHGLAGSGAEMAPLAAAIRGDGYRVIAPDQRGHGHRTRRPADVSRAAYVGDVVAVLDEPAWLVGQSMGAHTAMLTAAARPDLVRGLVMIEGGVGGSTDDYPARLGAWFAGWPVPFADEAAALAFLGDTPTGRSWVADLERTGDARPGRSRAGSRSGTGAPDQPNASARLGRKTAIGSPIDHLLVDERIGVRDPTAHARARSDHRMVLVTLTVPAELAGAGRRPGLPSAA